MEAPVSGVWLFLLAAGFFLLVFSMPLVFLIIVHDAPKTPGRVFRAALSLMIYVLLLAFLVRSAQNGNELASAVQANDQNAVEALLAKGISPDSCGFQGCPVDIAVKGQRWNILQLLIERGVQPVTRRLKNGTKVTTADDLEAIGRQDLASRLRENERKEMSRE